MLQQQIMFARRLELKSDYDPHNLQAAGRNRNISYCLGKKWFTFIYVVIIAMTYNYKMCIIL